MKSVEKVMNSYFADSFQMYTHVPTKGVPTTEHRCDAGEGKGLKNLSEVPFWSTYCRITACCQSKAAITDPDGLGLSSEAFQQMSSQGRRAREVQDVTI